MSINTKDRLIFALDVSEVDEAKALVKELADSITFYKIGMELMMTGEYFNLIDWLVKKDKKVERTTVLATLFTIFLDEYISAIK